MDDAEAFQNILGYRFGYVRGRGVGSKTKQLEAMQREKDIERDIQVDEVRREADEARREADEARREANEARRENAAMKERMDDLFGRFEELSNRIARNST